MEQHTVKTHGRRGIARRAVGVAAIAVFTVACSGSSDGGEAEVTAPATDLPAAPVTEAPVVTEAPAVTAAPVEEPAVDPAEIPDLPCEEYVEESGYPLKPCDKGVLVETLQRDLESLFPAIAIDGLFGNQTFGFIEEIQTANGLDANGLVSEEFAGQIADAESVDAVEADGATTDDGEAEAETPADTEEADSAEAEPASEALCNDLIGKADDPDFTAERIVECSDLGIDLVGEG